MANRMIRLGVNIDHIATLREVRKAVYPSVLEAVFLCDRAGADQITIHLREDRRHIQDHDLKEILQFSRLPVNLEMALTPEMMKIALKAKPYSVTLVPEKRQEMTTESGLDLKKLKSKANDLKKLASNLKLHAFIDADLDQVLLAKELGFAGVEFHTGTYAELGDRALGRSEDVKKFEAEKAKLFAAAKAADKLKLEVKAGHGLNLLNLGPLLLMPYLNEVNIGHSIVARAVMVGLEHAVGEVKTLLENLS